MPQCPLISSPLPDGRFHYDCQECGFSFSGPRASVSYECQEQMECLHFGERVGFTPCQGCGGTKTKLKVFQCAALGECTIGVRVPEIAGCCQNCKAYFPVVKNFLHACFALDVLPGTKHNCSLIDYYGRLLLAYRDISGKSTVKLCQIERTSFIEAIQTYPLRTDWHRTLDVLKVTDIPLDIPKSWADARGQEDPRLFTYRDELMLSYSGLRREEGRLKTYPMLARLTEQGKLLEDVKAEHISYHRRTWPFEKNWTYFQHDDQLLTVYSPLPHRVLRIEGNTAHDYCETPGRTWNYGHVRGGCSPVRLGDEYYHFFHGKKRYRPGSKSVYTIGVYTFEARPPFKVKRFASEPLLFPNPLEHPGGRIPNSIFPCGAILLRDWWIVSYGYDDCTRRISAFRFEDVEAALNQ